MHGLASIRAINDWAAERQLKQKLETMATRKRKKGKGKSC